MELNTIQSDQLQRFESNLDGYKSVVDDYYKSFPTFKQSQPKDNIIMAVLWNNINEKELIGSFNAILELRHFTFSNTITGHLRVKAKSEQVLQLLDNLLEKE
jgi:hypothetical protein